MAKVTTLFWDIGGVILTNGWDRVSRKQAAAQFNLDGEDLEDRHDQYFPALENGQVTLEQYLDRTIFYRPRTFSREQFKEFMFAQSQPYPESLAILEQLARSGRYLLATLNNEPRELNQYRIEQFGLRQDFIAFFSSCYLGARKPDEAIYRLALEVTQRAPEECVFIDDRALNLECARRLGMGTIHFQNAAQLREELSRHGVVIPAN
jgi:putative hydrolase of the HAD superfamily